jgi:hypothetical protein
MHRKRHRSATQGSLIIVKKKRHAARRGASFINIFPRSGMPSNAYKQKVPPEQAGHDGKRFQKNDDQ